MTDTITGPSRTAVVTHGARTAARGTTRGTRIARGAAAALAAAAVAAGAAACTMPTAEEIAGVRQAGTCPFTPDESVEGDVRIGWQALTNADVIVRDLGLLEACMPNADISWNRMEGATDTLQGLSSGSIDLGVIGSTGAFRAISTPLDQDLRIVWIHDVIGSSEALIAKDPAVKSIGDLRGGTIAVPFTSTSHYSLMAALDEAGMTVGRDVELINLAPDKMPSAWESDQVDAAWVWNPVQSKLAKTGHVVMTSADTADAGHPTQDVAVASGPFAEENPRFLEIWADAQAHAADMIREDPAAAAGHAGPDIGLPAAEIEGQFAGYRYQTPAEIEETLTGPFAAVCADGAEFQTGQGEVDVPADEARCRAAIDPRFAAHAADQQ